MQPNGSLLHCGHWCLDLFDLTSFLTPRSFDFRLWLEFFGSFWLFCTTLAGERTLGSVMGFRLRPGGV